MHHSEATRRLFNEIVIFPHAAEMSSINWHYCGGIEHGSLRREFLSFVIRLDSVPVITQSSTLSCR